MTFAIGIKDQFDVTVQRPHDAERANIAEPPSSTTSISASIAACHSGRADFFSGNAVM
jgi:hypothetical protein